MALPHDPARLIEAQDRLIDLLVQQDEARKAEDLPRMAALETEIGAATTHRDELRQNNLVK
jgi:hypothetical protein